MSKHIEVRRFSDLTFLGVLGVLRGSTAFSRISQLVGRSTSNSRAAAYGIPGRGLRQDAGTNVVGRISCGSAAGAISAMSSLADSGIPTTRSIVARGDLV